MKVDVKLYDKKGEVVLDAYHVKPSSVRALLASQWHSGRARVWYNYKKGFWNEFEFQSLKEFEHQQACCEEPALVESFA